MGDKLKRKEDQQDQFDAMMLAHHGKVRTSDGEYWRKDQLGEGVFEKIESEQNKVRKKKASGETLTCEDKLAYAITQDGFYDWDAKRRCEEEKTVQAKSETQTRRLESQKNDTKTDSLPFKDKLKRKEDQQDQFDAMMLAHHGKVRTSDGE